MEEMDFFRFLLIHGMTDEDLDSISIFDGWEYTGKENCDGVAYIFTNQIKGVKVIFRRRPNGDYQSINVLPTDASNAYSANYKEGFDTSKSQVPDIKNDILYGLCLSFNKMAREITKGSDKLWLCGIVPSVYDTSTIPTI